MEARINALDFKESNLSFAFKHHDPPRSLHSTGKSATEIKLDVLGSPRIKRLVREVAQSSDSTIKTVEEGAEAILDEIGHKMALPAARILACLLRGVLRNVLTAVNVNTDGIDLLSHTLKDWPVVLLPSHRSYLDFILISYVMFEHNIILPCIAAGQDFMSMRGISPLLRRSGAFFLRRTFGSDKLYKAVFSEYVKAVLCSGDNPMEFFVEGTRSRAGKSLHPRLGLLSMVLEPYLEGRLPDIMMVPISISYERTLEELLFAREFLGIPKPKESTTALFKAYSLLSEDYGSIYVHIGKPISLHEVCQHHGISRIPHSLVPREDSILLPEEWKVLTELGHMIIEHTHSGMVIFPTALVATILLQNVYGIELNELTSQVEWLKKQVLLLGGHISCVDKEPNIITSSGLKMLSTAVKSSSNNFIELSTSFDCVPRSQTPSLYTISDVISDKIECYHFKELTDISLVHLQLAYYRNQLFHLFLEDAMIALSLDTVLTDYGTARQKLSALHCALACEFVLPLKKPSEIFEEGVTRFLNRGILHRCSDGLQVQDTHKNQLHFLQNLLKPLVSCVWVVCHHLLSLGNGVQTLSVAIKGAQSLSAKCLQFEILNSFEILSLGVIKNALSSLHQAGFILQALNEFGTGKDRLVKVIEKDKLMLLADTLGGVVLSGYQSKL